MNSIIVKKGAIAMGAPFGKKRLKKFKPCNLKPVNIMFTKEDIDRKNVKMMELVTV